MKFLLIIIILFIHLCGCSDSSKELGGNYFLRIEGEHTNEILNRSPNRKGVPPDVIRYNYNNDFIIAEQKPNQYNDIMHDDSVNYKYGRKNLYYWVIFKKSNFCIGPLNEAEFNEARNKYKVPDKLELKSVY